MTTQDTHIYLTSASPRRRELLKQIGAHFEVLLLRSSPERRDVDETPLARELPEAYVRRLARAKAEAGALYSVARRLPKFPVLAADTTVILDGRIMGKPAGTEEAEEMLKRLSGRTHQVLTAVAVAFGARCEVSVSTTTVEFRELAEQEIRHYIATGEPLDKAGAYAIQGRAAIFIARIEGSYSGVMGLPLFETTQLLKSFNVTVL
jgi:septum formation protein